MCSRTPYVQYMYSYPHKTAYRPLSGVCLRDYGERFEGEGHGLYFHVPFCQSKCGYCNLFSVTGVETEGMEEYLRAVERQVRQYAGILGEAGTVFSDFTIGGGTPLLLEERQLEQVFDMAERYLRFDGDREIVIETAPNQTTGEKLGILKERGVTRLSMGVQSFWDGEMKTLGRSHSPAQARRALELVKAFDFPCVNVDLIYGIPGQSVASLLKSIGEAVEFGPDEIFLYPLYVKHGAGLVRQVRDGLVLDPERAYEEYREAAAYLRSRGFRQDSMRRFVRSRGAGDHGEGPGEGLRADIQKEETEQCRREHGGDREFSDCGFKTSLALGCGGRSYAGNLHFCTPYAISRAGCVAELKAFLECEDYTDIRHGIFLSEEEQQRRYVIRHLLIRPGLDRARYERRFGRDVLKDFPLLSRWLERGFLEERGGDRPRGTDDDGRESRWLTLTEEGLGLSDYLGPQLISSEIRRRMEEWDGIHGEGDGPLSRQSEKL